MKKIVGIGFTIFLLAFSISTAFTQQTVKTYPVSVRLDCTDDSCRYVFFEMLAPYSSDSAIESAKYQVALQYGNISFLSDGSVSFDGSNVTVQFRVNIPF
jgi:hypothetical protein